MSLLKSLLNSSLCSKEIRLHIIIGILCQESEHPALNPCLWGLATLKSHQIFRSISKKFSNSNNTQMILPTKMRRQITDRLIITCQARVSQRIIIQETVLELSLKLKQITLSLRNAHHNSIIEIIKVCCQTPIRPSVFYPHSQNLNYHNRPIREITVTCEWPHILDNNHYYFKMTLKEVAHLSQIVEELQLRLIIICKMMSIFRLLITGSSKGKKPRVGMAGTNNSSAQ